MPKINDLRSYLDVVRKAGEMHEIRREVDPVRELGAVLAACERAGKAAYFHAVKGFDIPRPRELEVTYTDKFVNIVLELREHIGRIRKA